jgi:hypothetical protein
MGITAHALLHDAGPFHRVYPDWPNGAPAPEYVSPAAPEAAQVPGQADELARLRADLKARGCSAEVVTLSPDERAERISDYALEA